MKVMVMANDEPNTERKTDEDAARRGTQPVSSAIPENFMKEGYVIIAPSREVFGTMFGINQGIQAKKGWTQKAWGEKAPKGWMQTGPKWMNAPIPEDFRERDPIDEIDFGGELTPALAADLSRLGITITKGSSQENRWRILVPQSKYDNVKNVLISAKVNYITKLTRGNSQ